MTDFLMTKPNYSVCWINNNSQEDDHLKGHWKTGNTKSAGIEMISPDIRLISNQIKIRGIYYNMSTKKTE